MTTLTFICVMLFQFSQFIYSDGLIHSKFKLNKNIEDGELVAAQTLCRHGDRNIYSTYPTDPWKSTEFWPGGLAALTDAGKLEHYILGKQLLQRYGNLLRNDTSSNTIYIQSTDTQRTVKSVEANLAGLLSLTYDEYRNTCAHWQPPIPVEIFPAADDYLLATSKKCDRFDYLMTKYLYQNDSYNLFFKRFKRLIIYLEKNAGIKIKRILDFVLLYDTLNVEKMRFKHLPDWAERVMELGGDFEQITLYWYQMHTGTNDMKKFKAGFLLKEILDRFRGKIQLNQSSNVSLWMHFAHDITIVNVLKSLGMYEVHFPPYSSCLLFELYKTNDTPYVQIFYKNSTFTQFPAMKIPNCGQKCALHKMYKLYDDILPKQSNYNECTLRDGEIIPDGGNPEGGKIVH